MQNIGLLPLSSLCSRLNWFVSLLLFWGGGGIVCGDSWAQIYVYGSCKY